MAFEELREQLKDRAAEVAAKIQESSAFNTLRERFESQTPTVQKAISVGGVVMAILFVLMFPYSYITSGGDSLAQFEENRELIQGLLRSARSANEAPPLPPAIPADQLRVTIEQLLKENGLLPDQTSPIENVPPDTHKEFAPAGVQYTAVAVPLKKLNVMQIIEIGNLLQNVGAGIKLMGVDVVQSAGQTHYYDMILQVVSFGIPALAGGEDTDSAPESGKGKGRATKPPVDTEGDF